MKNVMPWLVWCMDHQITGMVRFVKGKGRPFADTKVGRIFVSEGFDPKRPAYVGVGAHNAYWLHNQDVTDAFEMSAS